MSYGNLILDDGGMPIPQAIAAETATPTPLYSSNGALLIRNIDSPVDGITKVKMIAKDGKEIASTEAGIAVVLADISNNNYIHSGKGWVPAGQGKTLNIIPQASYTAVTNYSETVYNNGARNALIVIVGATAALMQQLILQIDVDGIFIDYATISITGAPGNLIVPVGVDVTPEANKCILPAFFRIAVKSSSASANQYAMSIQLI